MKIQLYSEVVEENGKTIRENNLTKSHTIPLGTLVEVERTVSFAKGTCLTGRVKMYVVDYMRDCDGTPLYVLGNTYMPEYWPKNPSSEQKVFRDYIFKTSYGYSEESLTIV